MIMAVSALLQSNPDPSDADIDTNVTNICRCGTFNRVRRGIHLAARINQDPIKKNPGNHNDGRGGA
jgi:isoquinoline 1-oxidoreductase alpha subunit